MPPGVFFVEEGLVRIRAEGKEMEVTPGQAFFSAPSTRQQWFEKDTRLLSVGLRCQWPDGQPVYSRGLNQVFDQKQIASLYEATRALFKSVHAQEKVVTYLESRSDQNRSLLAWAQHEAAFRGWFATYVQTLSQLGIEPQARQGIGDRRLEHLLSWLQAWPLDRSLDLHAAAQELGLSTRRIHQLLKEDLGMTAQVFLERRRLDHARQRLAQEDTPLKEIAFGLGFRHPPHFTTWFRRHTGMTPTAFRAGHGLEGA